MRQYYCHVLSMLGADIALNPQQQSVAIFCCAGCLSLQAMNVLGGPLQCCCKKPLTGYYRDGYCRTGGGDYGVHVVCAKVGARCQQCRRTDHHMLYAGVCCVVLAF